MESGDSFSFFLRILFSILLSIEPVTGKSSVSLSSGSRDFELKDIVSFYVTNKMTKLTVKSMRELFL